MNFTGLQCLARLSARSSQAFTSYLSLAALRRPGFNRFPVSNQYVPTRAVLKKADGIEATWSQNTTEVFINVPLADDVKGRDVNFEIHPKRLKLDVKGQTFLSGRFDETSEEPMVEPDGCFWNIDSIDDKRCLQIVLEKKEMGHESWEHLLEGEDMDTNFTDYVYLDVKIGDKDAGKILIGLYGNIVPKTVQNFLELCRGTSQSAKSGKKLTFAGSPFHRIIPRFMAQGGDITMGDGTGGESIYGERFDDENFLLKHDSAGLVSMANAGPNTNGSQFFILFEPQPHLDGKHTVFGKVLDEDSMKVVRRLEDLGTGSGKPKQPVLVSACDEFEVGEAPESGLSAEKP